MESGYIGVKKIKYRICFIGYKYLEMSPTTVKVQWLVKMKGWSDFCGSMIGFITFEMFYVHVFFKINFGFKIRITDENP